MDQNFEIFGLLIGKTAIKIEPLKLFTAILRLGFNKRNEIEENRTFASENSISG